MKRRLFIIIALALSIAEVNAFVEVTIDNISYKLYENEKRGDVFHLIPIAIVTGANKDATEITVNGSVVYNEKWYIVEEIEKAAFSGHKKLKNVSIITGSEKLNLPEETFSGCINLDSVHLKSDLGIQLSKKVFDGCPKLRSIYFSLPESVIPNGWNPNGISIGKEAFSQKNINIYVNSLSHIFIGGEETGNIFSFHEDHSRFSMSWSNYQSFYNRNYNLFVNNKQVKDLVYPSYALGYDKGVHLNIGNDIGVDP